MGKCVLCRKDIYTNEPALLFVDEHDTHYNICAKCKKQTDILLESENVLQTKQAMHYISECMRQLHDPQVLAFLTQTMEVNHAVIAQLEEWEH